VLAAVRASELAGDDAGAVALLERSVRALPTWGLGRLELGRLLLKSGERGQLAEFHLDVARALLPENSRAHYLYALALEDQGRPREARRALEVALALRDDYSDAWFRLAGLAFAQGDWAGAVTGYTRLLRYQPGDTGARLQLALALERSGAAKEAEARAASHAARPRAYPGDPPVGRPAGTRRPATRGPAPAGLGRSRASSKAATDPVEALS
jgi:tetratricopeptide (TPR) repeat protein